METSILRDMVSELLERGAKSAGAETRIAELPGDYGIERKLIEVADGQWEVREFETDKGFRATRNHYFGALDGLLGYLNSDHCKKDKGVVFVSETAVEVDLAYKDKELAMRNLKDRATLPLHHSDEYSALIEMSKAGETQHGLWRLLNRSLNGIIADMHRDADRFQVLVSQIQLKIGTDSTVEISPSGLSDGRAKNYIRIEFTGMDGSPSHQEIELDWTWTGRIWDEYDVEYTIPFRLEILLHEGELIFMFHPHRLEEAVRTARMELVKTIADSLPEQFTAHEGTL